MNRLLKGPGKPELMCEGCGRVLRDRRRVDVGRGHQARDFEANCAERMQIRDSAEPAGVGDTDNSDFEPLERVGVDFWQSRAGAP